MTSVDREPWTSRITRLRRARSTDGITDELAPIRSRSQPDTQAPAGTPRGRCSTVFSGGRVMADSKVKGKQRSRESPDGPTQDLTASPPKVPKKVYAAELLRLQ